MSRIKLGIIGLGVMGNRMVQAIVRYQLHDQIEVSIVCDSNEKVAQQFAAQLDGVSWTTDYRQVIENAHVDLVYVAAPPAYHHQLILDAIRQNKHVLCEKPLANSLSEAKEMLETATSAGIVHAINFPLNYGVALNHFAQLIADGFIGEIRRIRLDMHFPHWPRAWQQNAWIATRKQGGFILEVGVHWIQAIQKIFGQIAHVQSEVQFPEDGLACETSIVAKMLLESGTTVTVDGVSGIAGKERIALVAYGTEGTLAIENWGELYGGKAGELLERIALDDVPLRASLLENVVSAIRGETAEIYDFGIGYEAQVILEALRNPATTQMVDVRGRYL